MIDSHAHLDFDAFDGDRDLVLERARDAGVTAVVGIGIDVPTSEAAARSARSRSQLFAAVGLHPTSQVDDLEGSLRRIEQLAADHPGRVVAVGEIGLDYYWKDIPRDVQKERLERQLSLAERLGLPVILHCREALEDLFSLLEARSTIPAGVFHCFCGTADDAGRALALGFHISFAGNVTYPKAHGLQEAARCVPPHRLLVETDAPFLAPQPRRGKRNEPAFLRHTLDFLSQIKGMAPRELEEATAGATRGLFGLPQ